MNVSVTKSFLSRLQAPVLSCNCYSTIWRANIFFILMTIIFYYIPHNRQGATKLLALFSLQFEKNLATYWEGWCLILVSIFAFERYYRRDRAATCEKQCWIGLSILAAGLSLDELGSLHERADFLFASWGINGLIPLGIVTLTILIFTLHRMAYLANRRYFWLTLSAFIVLGSVVLQEHLEHHLRWPWWTRGIRFGIEEGSELVGIFLLLCTVLPPTGGSKKARSIARLAPRMETLVGLRPTVICLTGLGFIPLGILTVITIPITDDRGIPAAWLPAILLNLACMVSWACALRGEAYRQRFLFASFLALFFSLDQIIIFQRVADIGLMRGEVENFMFPCMAGVCMWIPTLRTRFNICLLGILLPLGLFLVHPSALLPRLVIPLQALGIFYVLTSAGLRPSGQRVAPSQSDSTSASRGYALRSTL